MGYTFKKDYKISITTQKGLAVTVEKAEPVLHNVSAADAVLKKLRKFLDASEPELVYFLVNNWNSQGKSITYKELREAILNGTLSTDYLKQWQQDYSKFVTEHLQPAWMNAMEEATSEMAVKYPEWNFDPYADGVRKWTQSRAAEFVTNSSLTQIEGLRAVVMKAAVLEDMSVDKLARAIRPMVGLTKQQSVANLNYYEKLVKNGTSEAKAQELSARYAARQHRYRAYNIARTELAFAYNQGSYEGTKQAQEAGYMGEVVKIWCTAEDERVCDICGSLEGKQIPMDEDIYYEVKDEHGNTIKHRINPKLEGDEVAKVPPAHPSCRCAVMYEEISPPIYKPTEQPADKPEDAASDKDDAPTASVPEDFAPPDNLKYVGYSDMGGTGTSYIYRDADGEEWIFKPGETKNGQMAYYKAYVQEAGYKVQYIVDPETAVPIGKYTNKSGVFGAIQKRIKGSDIKKELYKLYQDGDLPAELKSQLQREHVTDWLLANFDAHNRNFVADSAGRLVGVDKDQAFRYLFKGGAQKMSYTYHPNVIYGEDEPIYNALYRLFAEGEIDLDLNDVLPYIKRVESISSKEYREIFREYAESRVGKGKAAEELLDAIVSRKDGLRETYRTFYEELMETRTGKKIAFKFADEGVAAVKQTVASQTMTKEAALKLTSADLKKMAKEKGIPNFGNMTKDQLATCISDPTQIEAVNEQVKAKLADQAARRAARATTTTVDTPKPKYGPVNGVYNADEVFDDFSAIPVGNKRGIPLASDADKVEGLNLTARRIKLGNDDYYEFSGKLTETATDAIDAAVTQKRGTQRHKIVFGEGLDLGDKIAIHDAKAVTDARGVRYSKDGVTMELITDKRKRAIMGTIRIRIPDTGDAIADAAKARNILKNSQFSFVLETPLEESEELMKKARLLFQKNPNLAVKLGQEADKTSAINRLLRQAGIQTDDIKTMVKKEVCPGYFTYVNEGAHKAYQKAGMEYVWTGVNRESSIVSMVKEGGNLSSLSRIRVGKTGHGASVSSDIRTGGADNVFTRVATRYANANGAKYSYSFANGNYQILMKPSVTDRTDWYAYHSDSYGTTESDRMSIRPDALEFFKDENSHYNSDNELMFRHGISVEDWLGIDCGSQTYKDRLVKAMKDEGINQINGTPVEKFIRVNTTVGMPWK